MSSGSTGKIPETLAGDAISDGRRSWMMASGAGTLPAGSYPCRPRHTRSFLEFRYTAPDQRGRRSHVAADPSIGGDCRDHFPTFLVLTGRTRQESLVRGSWQEPNLRRADQTHAELDVLSRAPGWAEHLAAVYEGDHARGAALHLAEREGPPPAGLRRSAFHDPPDLHESEGRRQPRTSPGPRSWFSLLFLGDYSQSRFL